MSLYHFQCIAPLLIALAIGFGISMYGSVKGWW